MENENTIEHPTVHAIKNVTMLESIVEIEQHFRQGTLDYTAGISRFNIEIEKLKNLISSAKRNKKNDEESLLALLSEIDYDEKLLTRLNEKFINKVKFIQELAREYMTLVDKSDYEKMHQRKRYEVEEIQDEIEMLEITLLSRELQHQNLLEKLYPIRLEIKRLKTELKELELEKAHFESTKLQQVSLIQKHHKIPLLDKVVDTEVIEDSND